MTISGLLAIVAYLSLSVIAAASFPTAFGPATNWLSDLGNQLLNPQGAVFYRLAAIATGALLLLFFATLGSSLRRQRVGRPVFATLAEACALVGCAALILTGVYSEERGVSHSACSIALFVAFGTAILLLGWVFRSLPARGRWLSSVAFAIALAPLSFAVLHVYWLEWLAVALMLAFVGVTALALTKETAQESSKA